MASNIFYHASISKYYILILKQSIQATKSAIAAKQCYLGTTTTAKLHSIHLFGLSEVLAWIAICPKHSITTTMLPQNWSLLSFSFLFKQNPFSTLYGDGKTSTLLLHMLRKFLPCSHLNIFSTNP